MPANILFLTVLPLIRPSAYRDASGKFTVIPRSNSVEQVLTLYPERNFATEFYPDEVQFYIDALNANIDALRGGTCRRVRDFARANQ
jgi:hypothetical protein